MLSSNANSSFQFQFSLRRKSRKFSNFGRLLPHKVTRHVIPSRPLGVNVPLDLLINHTHEEATRNSIDSLIKTCEQKTTRLSRRRKTIPRGATCLRTLTVSNLYPTLLYSHYIGSLLPKEITDQDEFVKMSEKALECRVKRYENTVKLKLRTTRQLYTLKVDPTKAAELLKQIKCEVIEA